jgi:hypothetical protein
VTRSTPEVPSGSATTLSGMSDTTAVHKGGKDRPRYSRLTRVVQMRFSDEQYDELRELAAEEGINIGALVRRIVGLALIDPEAPVDIDAASPELIARWRDALELVDELREHE